MSNSLSQKSDRNRERILKQLNAAKDRHYGPVPERDRSVRVFPRPDNLVETFSRELSALRGTVVVCQSEVEIKEGLESIIRTRNLNCIFCRDGDLMEKFGDQKVWTDNPLEFEGMQAAVTPCELLVARTGSVLVSSAHPSGRLLNVFPPVHIVIAAASRIVPFLEDAFEWIEERYGGNRPSQMTFISGASRTADIEKTLVMGAHGPKELIVFIDANN